MLWWTLRQLESKDYDTRLKAVRKLSTSRDPRAVEALVRALKDQDEFIRRCAIESLTEIAGVQAIEPLTEALNDYHPNVRGAVVKALEIIGDSKAIEPLVAAAVDEDSVIQGDAMKALKKINPNWPKTDSARRTVPKLIAILNDKERGRDAARILGMIGDSHAVEPLAKVLLDEEKEYGDEHRACAATALGRIRNEHAINKLLEALSMEGWYNSTLVPKKVIEQIVEIGDARAVDPLKRILYEDAFESHRGDFAAPALTKFGEAGKDVLVQTLSNYEIKWYVRYGAAKALQSIGWEPKDNTQKVLFAIALKEFDKTDALDKTTIGSVVDALLATLEKLINIPHDYRTSDYRVSIIDTLGSIGLARAVKPLLKFEFDEEYKQKVSAALHDILKKDSTNIETEDLRAMVTLRGETVAITQYDRSIDGDITVGTGEYPDYSKVRALAEKELARRQTKI